MSDEEVKEDSTGGYTVGFGRPPLATRFKPGASGNPRGRPKGVKSLATVLDDALSRYVTVQEKGRERRMRAQDVIIHGLVNDAARRDTKAIKLLFGLMERYIGNAEGQIDRSAQSAEDKEIIERYLASLSEARGNVTGPLTIDALRDSVERPRRGLDSP
jgi:hypothetical protein